LLSVEGDAACVVPPPCSNITQWPYPDLLRERKPPLSELRAEGHHTVRVRLSPTLRYALNSADFDPVQLSGSRCSEAQD